MSSFEGFLDSVEDKKVSGWARNINNDAEAVLVAIWTNQSERPVYVRAAIFRGDLKAAGKGSGHHGFELILKERGSEVTHAKIVGAAEELVGSPLHTSADVAISERGQAKHCASLLAAAGRVVEQMLMDS